MWIRGILDKGWEKIARQSHLQGSKIEAAIYERLTGLGITEAQVSAAMREASPPENPMNWGPEDLLKIADCVRRFSKPMLIALNKADVTDDDLLIRLSKVRNYTAIPTCAETELALKKASKSKLVDYIPGDEKFTVSEPSKLNTAQKKALDKMDVNVKRFNGTGVQSCLEKAVYDMLDLIVVYPVEDETRLTDHDGRVLPDAFLVKKGTTAKELAFKVHTDLGENFIRAINVRTHRTVGNDYVLQNNDVMTIVARK